MKDDHHVGKPCSRGGRVYTATAILGAIAYMVGVITSPLLSLKNCGGRVEEAKPVIQQCNSKELGGDLTRFEPRCATALPAERVRQRLIEGLFNGTSPFEGFPPEHARGWLRQKRIKGWGSTGPVFERLMREVRPRIVVELGTFLGASALHMAALARQLRIQTLILCVDDFRGWPTFRLKFRDIGLRNGDVTLLYQFMQNVAHMNATESVLPLPFSTVSMVRKLCEWGIYADLIEVDAAHDFLSAWADINAAYGILRPGGVMFGHDYHTKLDNSGVRRAVNLFARLRNLRVEPDGEHWILRAV